MNSSRQPVAVVVGATSKWQADGRNTKLAHGRVLDDSALPVGVRWGVGGAIAQKFAQEGFVVVLTTRNAANATALEKAIKEQGGECLIVELDLVSRDSISRAFATIRDTVGDPEVLVYEEYSEFGVHVANVVIDGLIDSPGTRALPRAQQPEVVMNPVKIAEAFYYLHTQDTSCWTHELQLTPFATKPGF
jgi:NAD(P)-dependent dehydrogenase (short-subunit alcohol dehydrogenase family)